LDNGGPHKCSARILGGALSKDRHLPSWLQGPLALPPVCTTTCAQRITSSASKSRDGGIVIPSAWAVLRLMTSSKRVGCSTGTSAGLAPFRILSTYVAPRRHPSGRLGP